MVERIKITENICDENYYYFIDYLLKKSDIFTFSLPNFGKLIRTYDDERVIKQLDDGSDFFRYKKKCMNKIKKITDHQIKMYRSEKYGRSIYDREREIYVVRIDDSLDRSFFNNKGLFDWQYPKYPEDFCFYRNGQCVMNSISHEKWCFCYFVDEELKKFLDRTQIRFFEEECSDIPTFKI